MGKIADIIEARGELDEALRIRQDEELPVYLRLKTARDALWCKKEIGLSLLKRNNPDDRSQAAEYLQQALATAQQLRLPEAETIAQIIEEAGI